MNEDSIMTDEQVAALKVRPIDYSDIPKITREYLAHCWIRFRNRPVEQGGAWHRPVRNEDLSEEVRCKVDQMMRRSEDAETRHSLREGCEVLPCSEKQESAKLEAATCDTAAFK